MASTIKTKILPENLKNLKIVGMDPFDKKVLDNLSHLQKLELALSRKIDYFVVKNMSNLNELILSKVNQTLMFINLPKIRRIQVEGSNLEFNGLDAEF